MLKLFIDAKISPSNMRQATKKKNKQFIKPVCHKRAEKSDLKHIHTYPKYNI